MFFFSCFHWLKDRTAGQPSTFPSVKEIVMEELISAQPCRIFLKIYMHALHNRQIDVLPRETETVHRVLKMDSQSSCDQDLLSTDVVRNTFISVLFFFFDKFPHKLGKISDPDQLHVCSVQCPVKKKCFPLLYVLRFFNTTLPLCTLIQPHHCHLQVYI